MSLLSHVAKCLNAWCDRLWARGATTIGERRRILADVGRAMADFEISTHR